MSRLKLLAKTKISNKSISLTNSSHYCRTEKLVISINNKRAILRKSFAETMWSPGASLRHLDPVHTTPFSNENDTVLFRIRLTSTLQRRVRKRIVSKTLSRVERFENGTVWKRCFPSVDGENDTISENDDVTATPPPGCWPLNREYTR